LPSEEAEERAAGYVLFAGEASERKYLILRHRHGGHWGFAKGRAEVGESRLETAQREVLEETGIDSIESVPAFLWISRYAFVRDGRPVDKTVHYYLGRTSDTSLALSAEHTQAEWLPYDAARQRLTHLETKRLLDAAEARLSKVGAEQHGR